MDLKELIKAVATFNWSALGKLLSYTWSGKPDLHEVEPHLAGFLARASIWACAGAAFLAALIAQCYAAPAGRFYLEALWEIVARDGVEYAAQPLLLATAAFGTTLLCIHVRAKGIERWANHGPLVRWVWWGIFIISCLTTAVMTLATWTSSHYLGAAAYSAFKTGISRHIAGLLATLVLLLVIYWAVLSRCYRRLISLLPPVLTRAQRREVLLSVLLMPALILISSLLVSATVPEVRGDPSREINRSMDLAEVSMTVMTCAPAGDNVACVMNLWTGLPQDYTLIGAWASHAGPGKDQAPPASSAIAWTPAAAAASAIPVVKLTPMEQVDIEIQSPKAQACAIVRAFDRPEQPPAMFFQVRGHENSRVTEEYRTIHLRAVNVPTLRSELISACKSV